MSDDQHESHNAFENSNPPLFEQMQRELEPEDVEDTVERILRDLPPGEREITGIEHNIQRLKDNGNWATARFYETLLAKRAAQEG